MLHNSFILPSMINGLPRAFSSHSINKSAAEVNENTQCLLRSRLGAGTLFLLMFRGQNKPQGASHQEWDGRNIFSLQWEGLQYHRAKRDTGRNGQWQCEYTLPWGDKWLRKWVFCIDHVEWMFIQRRRKTLAQRSREKESNILFLILLYRNEREGPKGLRDFGYKWTWWTVMLRLRRSAKNVVTASMLLR